jgi:hypothetical protein
MLDLYVGINFIKSLLADAHTPAVKAAALEGIIALSVRKYDAFARDGYNYSLFDVVVPFLEDLNPVTLAAAIRCFPHVEHANREMSYQVRLWIAVAWPPPPLLPIKGAAWCSPPDAQVVDRICRFSLKADVEVSKAAASSMRDFTLVDPGMYMVYILSQSCSQLNLFFYTDEGFILKYRPHPPPIPLLPAP